MPLVAHRHVLLPLVEVLGRKHISFLRAPLVVVTRKPVPPDCMAEKGLHSWLGMVPE